jgi:hypothetical protein
MRDSLKTAVERAYAQGWDFKAGDFVAWIAEDGTETNLLTIRRAGSRDGGLEVGSGGLQEERTTTLVFLRSYLESKGVEIDPAGHFKIKGERWDLAEGDPIRRDTGPIGGSHPLVVVKARRAAEGEAERAGSTFGWTGG